MQEFLTKFENCEFIEDITTKFPDTIKGITNCLEASKVVNGALFHNEAVELPGTTGKKKDAMEDEIKVQVLFVLI